MDQGRPSTLFAGCVRATGGHRGHEGREPVDARDSRVLQKAGQQTNVGQCLSVGHGGPNLVKRTDNQTSKQGRANQASCTLLERLDRVDSARQRPGQLVVKAQKHKGEGDSWRPARLGAQGVADTYLSCTKKTGNPALNAAATGRIMTGDVEFSHRFGAYVGRCRPIPSTGKRISHRRSSVTPLQDAILDRGARRASGFSASHGRRLDQF